MLIHFKNNRKLTTIISMISMMMCVQSIGAVKQTAEANHERDMKQIKDAIGKVKEEEAAKTKALNNVIEKVQDLRQKPLPQEEAQEANRAAFQNIIDYITKITK